MYAENIDVMLNDTRILFRIYLVGFLESAEAQRAPCISELIQSLVPESRVQTQTIFNHIYEPAIPDADLEDEYDAGGTEDETTSLSSTSTSGEDGTESAASIHNMTGHGYFSPGWIQSEALSLLNRMRQQCGTGVQGKRIILAGHGFGGIVVKQVKELPVVFSIESLLMPGQAIAIANTTPRYYPVAQSIASLVFFATPHGSAEYITWEEAMLAMIRVDSTCRYKGRLELEAVSALADSVSQLSHVFYRFASKYPITNFVYGCHAAIQQFNSDFETVVPWKQDASSEAMHGAIEEDIGIYEALRRHFSPLYTPSNSHHSPGMFSSYHCYEILCPRERYWNESDGAQNSV